MTKFKSQGLGNTFRNAAKGLRLVLKSERNIRIHAIVAVIVLMLAQVLGFSTVKFCILLLTISSVMVTEMLNTGIEFALDSIFRNKYSRLVGMAKDISAGAVMLATVVSVIIGIILFGEALLVKSVPV